MPAFACAELTSKEAPGSTVSDRPAMIWTVPASPFTLFAETMPCPATTISRPVTRTEPPGPFLLFALIFALAPILTSLVAATLTVPPLRAVTRPLILALLAATIWIEPLRTTMPLALRNPLLLTDDANFTACAALTASRCPTNTFWPVRRTASTALTRPRMRILPSGETGNVPASRLLTALWLIWPERLTTPSTNSRVGVETFSAPTFTTPDDPTMKPPGAAK